MQKAEKEASDEIETVLGREGFRISFQPNHRHPRFVVVAPCGWTRMILVPCSGRSDSTSQGNFARQKAMRVLREYRRRNDRNDASWAFLAIP